MAWHLRQPHQDKMLPVWPKYKYIAALADAGQHLEIVVGDFTSSEKVVRLREVPAGMRHLCTGKKSAMQTQLMVHNDNSDSTAAGRVHAGKQGGPHLLGECSQLESEAISCGNKV